MISTGLIGREGAYLARKRTYKEAIVLQKLRYLRLRAGRTVFAATFGSAIELKQLPTAFIPHLLRGRVACLLVFRWCSQLHIAVSI